MHKLTKPKKNKRIMDSLSFSSPLFSWSPQRRCCWKTPTTRWSDKSSTPKPALARLWATILCSGWSTTSHYSRRSTTSSTQTKRSTHSGSRFSKGIWRERSNTRGSTCRQSTAWLNSPIWLAPSSRGLSWDWEVVSAKSCTGQNLHLGQNLPEWPEWPKTARNLTRGGTWGILVPVCILVRKILAILARTKRNQ